MIGNLARNAAVAAKLYTGVLNLYIVSQWLENSYVPQLVEQLRRFIGGTTLWARTDDTKHHRQVPAEAEQDAYPVKMATQLTLKRS